MDQKLYFQNLREKYKSLAKIAPRPDRIKNIIKIINHEIRIAK